MINIAHYENLKYMIFPIFNKYSKMALILISVNNIIIIYIFFSGEFQGIKFYFF